MPPQQQKDWYRILGAAPCCDTAELQRRYREALADCNPSKPENAARRPWAERRTRQVVDAFNFLKVEEQRMGYDHQAHLQPRLARKAAILKAREEQSGSGLLSRLFKKTEPKNPSGNLFKMNAEKQFDRGVTMAHNDKFVEARDCFKEAFSNDATHLEAAYNLALMEYKMGRFPAAVAAFREVLKLDPADFYAKLMVEMLTEEEG